MSGGTWQYENGRIPAILFEIAEDIETREHGFPDLAAELKLLGTVLGNVLHELDYHIAGDSHIPDLHTWERSALRRIRNSISETGGSS